METGNAPKAAKKKNHISNGELLLKENRGLSLT